MSVKASWACLMRRRTTSSSFSMQLRSNSASNSVFWRTWIFRFWLASWAKFWETILYHCGSSKTLCCSAIYLKFLNAVLMSLVRYAWTSWAILAKTLSGIYSSISKSCSAPCSWTFNRSIFSCIDYCIEFSSCWNKSRSSCNAMLLISSPFTIIIFI